VPVRCAAPKLSATADGLGRDCEYCEYSQVLVEHDGRPGQARREPRRVEVGANRRHAVGAQLLRGYSRALTGTAVVPRRVEVGANRRTAAGALQPAAPIRCSTLKSRISCTCRRVAARSNNLCVHPARARSRAGRLRSADALPPVGCGHAGALESHAAAHALAFARAAPPSFAKAAWAAADDRWSLNRNRATPRSASGPRASRSKPL
jgi:hypothetical protein